MIKVACFFLSIFTFQNAAFSMSVEEAYKAIPHHQTTFMANQSVLKPEESQFLEKFFSVVDRAVVMRVGQYANVFYKKTRAPTNDGYHDIFKQLKSMSSNKKYSKVVSLVYDAITFQKKYLDLWEHANTTNSDFKGLPKHRHSLVTTSSNQLKKAYNLLMQLHPNESKNNKKSFFDHLCALDFL